MASLTGAMVKVINAGKADGPFSLPPQLDFPGVEEWYKTIRSYRRVKPRLAGGPPEEPVINTPGPEEPDLTPASTLP